jgi:hypothetical protein
MKQFEMRCTGCNISQFMDSGFLTFKANHGDCRLKVAEILEDIITISENTEVLKCLSKHGNSHATLMALIMRLVKHVEGLEKRVEELEL